MRNGIRTVWFILNSGDSTVRHCKKLDDSHVLAKITAEVSLLQTVSYRFMKWSVSVYIASVSLKLPAS